METFEILIGMKLDEVEHLRHSHMIEAESAQQAAGIFRYQDVGKWHVMVLIDNSNGQIIAKYDSEKGYESIYG